MSLPIQSMNIILNTLEQKMLVRFFNVFPWLRYFFELFNVTFCKIDLKKCKIFTDRNNFTMYLFR